MSRQSKPLAALVERITYNAARTPRPTISPNTTGTVLARNMPATPVAEARFTLLPVSSGRSGSNAAQNARQKVSMRSYVLCSVVGSRSDRRFLSQIAGLEDCFAQT